MADSLLSGQKYYFRVRSEDADGNLSEWSEASFWTQGGIPIDGSKYYIRFKYRDANGIERDWSTYDDPVEANNNWFITSHSAEGEGTILIIGSGEASGGPRTAQGEGTVLISGTGEASSRKTAQGRGVIRISGSGDAAKGATAQGNGTILFSGSGSAAVNDLYVLDMDEKKYYLRFKYRDANGVESDWSTYNDETESNNNWFITSLGTTKKTAA